MLVGTTFSQRESSCEQSLSTCRIVTISSLHYNAHNMENSNASCSSFHYSLIFHGGQGTPNFQILFQLSLPVTTTTSLHNKE